MRYKVEVVWEIDEEDAKDVTYLPKFVAIPYDIKENDVCDYLSNQFGFLVQSWAFAE